MDRFILEKSNNSEEMVQEINIIMMDEFFKVFGMIIDLLHDFMLISVQMIV